MADSWLYESKNHHSSLYKSLGLRFLNLLSFLGSTRFAESCAFVSKDLAQVNSRAKINRPAITGGRVKGPGRIIKTPPMAMSVNPITKTINLRTGVGTPRQIFRYSTV